LERDHGGKPGEPLLPPMEVVLAEIMKEEREQAERERESKANEARLPPMEVVIAEIMMEEREREARAPLFPVFATPIAESENEP